MTETSIGSHHDLLEQKIEKIEHGFKLKQLFLESSLSSHLELEMHLEYNHLHSSKTQWKKKLSKIISQINLSLNEKYCILLLINMFYFVYLVKSIHIYFVLPKRTWLYAMTSCQIPYWIYRRTHKNAVYSWCFVIETWWRRWPFYSFYDVDIVLLTLQIFNKNEMDFSHLWVHHCCTYILKKCTLKKMNDKRTFPICLSF